MNWNTARGRNTYSDTDSLQVKEVELKIFEEVHIDNTDKNIEIYK